MGLSIATLLSQHHKVTAVDIVPEKVELINNRKSPIQDDYIEKYLAEKELDLTATLDAKEAYSDADFVVIAAPTNYDSKKNFFDTSAVPKGFLLLVHTGSVLRPTQTLRALRQERQAIEEEQGDLATVKKNFEFFLACLKELPDTNSAGMPLKVNGLDVQGTLMRDAEGNPIEGRARAITSGKLKVTPERIAEAPDML